MLGFEKDVDESNTFGLGPKYFISSKIKTWSCIVFSFSVENKTLPVGSRDSMLLVEASRVPSALSELYSGTHDGSLSISSDSFVLCHDSNLRPAMDNKWNHSLVEKAKAVAFKKTCSTLSL